jgi:hypothetical protein
MKLKDFVTNVALVTVIVLFVVYAGLNQVAQAQTQTLTATITNTESILTSQTATTETSSLVCDGSWYAQTFQYSQKFSLTKVSLLLDKGSNVPTGNFTVSIRKTSGGLPTGSDLVSVSIPGSSITNAGYGVWYNFTMNIVLNASTTYAIVARLPDGDGTHYVGWFYKSGDPYPNGTYVYSSNSGSTWSISSTYDFEFIVYGFAVTPVTLTFSDTISSVNYVKVNGVPWTDYTYSGNTLTVNNLSNLVNNIEASVYTGGFSPFFVPMFTILICLSVIFITADALYLWKTVRGEGLQT